MILSRGGYCTKSPEAVNGHGHRAHGPGQGIGSTSSGVNYGVYGETISSSGYAGYFVGRGYFSDNVGINIQQPAVPLHVIGGTDASLSGGVHTPARRAGRGAASSQSGVACGGDPAAGDWTT